jgi:hypothetical protein
MKEFMLLPRLFLKMGSALELGHFYYDYFLDFMDSELSRTLRFLRNTDDDRYRGRIFGDCLGKLSHVKG